MFYRIIVKYRHHAQRSWFFPTVAFVIVMGISCIHEVPGFPVTSLLQALGIASLPHRFMDLYGVSAWCEFYRAGGNPVSEQTFILFPGEAPHPNFRMNYSPCVYLLSYIGLTSVTVPFWGIILSCLYITSVWILARPTTTKESVFWLAIVFSPASALVMERANIDSLIFAFMMSALLLRNRPWAGSGFILAASSLKFFPAAAFVAPFGDNRPKARIAALVSFGLFLMLLVFLSGRLGAIATSLGSQTHTAFGAALPAGLLRESGYIREDFSNHMRIVLQWVALILFLTLFFGGFRRRGCNLILTERSYYAFLMGGPMFFLLFLSGNQMDYKIIFLFFMLPAVLELRSCGEHAIVTLANIWIILICTYSYWNLFSDEGSLRNALLKQFVMWCVFGVTAILSGGIIPRSKLAL